MDVQQAQQLAEEAAALVKRLEALACDALKARGGLGFLLDDDQIHWSGGCRIDVDRVRPRVDVRIEEAR